MDKIKEIQNSKIKIRNGDRPGAPAKGFLLMEVLLSIAILSIAVAACLGVMGQALYVSKKTEEATRTIAGAEELLFLLETGMRPDLVFYGGRGKMPGEKKYEIQSEEFREESESQTTGEGEAADKLSSAPVFRRLEIEISDEKAIPGIRWDLLLASEF